MNHQKATGKETARATSGWQRLKGARAPEPGLHIVATPIGALADITLRALDTLAGADLIACEDTRTTRVLLDAYGISARLMAYHEHNADKAGPQILAALDDSAVVALVSDAGTPLLSDPGYRLVEEVLKSGHKVVPVPGASALLAALVGSGLPTDGIYFAGFLPPKSAARRARLEALGETPATLVLYEAPHRIGEALADCAAVFGPERRAVLARELTKTFEEFRRGSLSALIEAQEDDPAR
ncbi:MAG: 16S rRNA (cytidine(1402)-2'-O)-methyltransferase, partial [Hyphomicrobiaceae bacterium]|nr:16S rRNA (cytidine(1402)-2'-O)-methyltransferase [Hyphomicrobiaceae bacterium]